MKRIVTIETRGFAYGIAGEGCGECQTSCQSACKTSCGVTNQKCENISGIILNPETEIRS